MQLTKQQLEKELKEVEQKEAETLEQAKAVLNSLAGQRALLQRLIAELDKPEESTELDKPEESDTTNSKTNEEGGKV